MDNVSSQDNFDIFLKNFENSIEYESFKIGILLFSYPCTILQNPYFYQLSKEEQWKYFDEQIIKFFNVVGNNPTQTSLKLYIEKYGVPPIIQHGIQ